MGRPDFTPARYDQFAAEAIAEMIQAGREVLDYASYARLQQRLKAYADLWFDGIYAEFERQIGFKKSVLTQWINKDTRPKIQQLLLLCFRLGTTPVKLLRDEPPSADSKIGRSYPEHASRTRIKLTANQRKQLLSDLKAIIDDTDEVISLKEACKRVGYTNNFIKYWFPDEYRRITEKRKRYVTEKSMSKDHLAEETAYKIVFGLLSEQGHFSSKVVEQLLRPYKLSLVKPAVREGVKRAKAEYFSLC